MELTAGAAKTTPSKRKDFCLKQTFQHILPARFPVNYRHFETHFSFIAFPVNAESRFTTLQLDIFQHKYRKVIFRKYFPAFMTFDPKKFSFIFTTSFTSSSLTTEVVYSRCNWLIHGMLVCLFVNEFARIMPQLRILINVILRRAKSTLVDFIISSVIIIWCEN